MYGFNMTLEPLWVFRATLKKGQEVKPHAHDYYYHMVYIITGRYDLTTNGESYKLSDNMLTIARPGETQGWKNSESTPVNTYEIKFAVFDEDLRNAIAGLPSVVCGNLFVKTLLDKIAQEKDSLRKDYQQYISIYLNALLYDLVRDRIAATEDKPEDARRLSPAQIAIRYIQDHYREDISLEDIAAATNFNKSYLATAFRRSEGSTINEYIYKARIYKACELIAYSDLPLSDVSSMTGFKHIQHFNRVFKKYIGIPPGEYRDATPKQLINYGHKAGKQFNSDILPVRSGRIFEVESATGYYRLKKTEDK